MVRSATGGEDRGEGAGCWDDGVAGDNWLLMVLEEQIVR